MSNNLKDYIVLTPEQRQRLQSTYQRYRLLYQDPANSSPMITVAVIDHTQDIAPPTWEQMLADPLVMLKSQLDSIKSRLRINDDSCPIVRIDFGTAQIPAAFGCELGFPENSLPAAKNHSLHDIKDVHKLQKPPLDAGWFGKLDQWTDIWLANLPDGIIIQHPDIQSAFNSALLIRGSEFLTDLYDDPQSCFALMDLVTDFMIDITTHMRKAITSDPHWFFDWSGLWKGRARISNCSMHLISSQFYHQHVLPHDKRFIDAMGGGRIHYCGTQSQVLQHFYTIPGLTGLDIDIAHHDLYDICQQMPEHIPLLINPPPDSQLMERLLDGDWPKKRNIIIGTWAYSPEQGDDLLARLRDVTSRL